MMPHEDRTGQVIKPLPAVLARVAAAFLSPMVFAALVDPVRIAVRTMHLIRPTPLSDFIVALSFVYQFVYTAHCSQVLGRRSLDSTMSSKPNMSLV
jgi:hypothetical protein